MKKSTYLIIGLIIALVICVFFLLQPDQQHDTHTEQHVEVISDKDSLKAHDAIRDRKIDSLKQYATQQEGIIKDLLTGQEQSKAEVNKWATEAKALAAQVKAGNKDTSLNAKVDSLVDVVNSLTGFLVQYELYTDSLNRANAALKVNYEAKDAEFEKQIAELHAAYDKLFKAYQDLFADSQSLQKDLRRQKLKTKVAAVLAGAAAVLGLIK